MAPGRSEDRAEADGVRARRTMLRRDSECILDSSGASRAGTSRSPLTVIQMSAGASGIPALGSLRVRSQAAADPGNRARNSVRCSLTAAVRPRRSEDPGARGSEGRGVGARRGEGDGPLLDAGEAAVPSPEGVPDVRDPVEDLDERQFAAARQHDVRGPGKRGLPVDRPFRVGAPTATRSRADDQLLCSEVDRVAWLVGARGVFEIGTQVAVRGSGDSCPDGQ